MRSGSLIGTLHTPVNWVYRSHMERSSRPSMTSMSLARFSLKYTTYFPMGINAYGGIYSRSSTLARRDWIEFPYASLSRRSTSGVSTGNVLGYCRNLGSLRYGTSTAYLPCQVAARLSRRFSRSNLRILWRNDRLYSQMPRPFWRDLAGIIAIGSCSSAADPLVRFLPLHEPIVVQFHCVIE